MGEVTTLAGNGKQGTVDGIGTAAGFVIPEGIGTDLAGNVYVSDVVSNLIRKITPQAQVSTFAGNGVSGATNGNLLASSFSQPGGITTDAVGNFYIADSNNNLIRKINTLGQVSTLAGNGAQISVDGNGVNASFSSPLGIATDGIGNLYVTDNTSFVIRKITPSGDVSTLAGSGLTGSNDGIGTAASFDRPNGIALDGAGNIYIGDTGNNLIRKICITGYSISPALPAGVSFDATTGAISGTPTVKSPLTTYTVNAFNLGGSSTKTFSLSVLQAQTISFNPLTKVLSLATDFSPGATATSNLPINYTSNNTAVATITSDGKIHIVGAGTTEITASQPGDNINYASAIPVTQTLTVLFALPSTNFGLERRLGRQACCFRDR